MSEFLINQAWAALELEVSLADAVMRANPIAVAVRPAHAGLMSTLKAPQIEALRTQLAQREQQLRQELEQAQAEEEAHVEEKEDMPREPDANQTREVTDREVRHAELLRDQRELQAVRAALQRIEDGSYGECVDCGKRIKAERLLASPAAMRCIDCQTKAEARL